MLHFIQIKRSPYSVLLAEEGGVQKQTKYGYRPTWNASTMGSNVIYEGALPLSAEELSVVCTLPPQRHTNAHGTPTPLP